MKLKTWAVMVCLILAGCGGDSGTDPGPGSSGDNNDNNNSPVPVATAPGSPSGTPVTTTIGAAGGTLVSGDGLLWIDVPAGALGADTDISIQPLNNTAWGGVGAGYRLTPDGLTFSQPVDLVFAVAPDVLAGSAAAFLDVGVQDEQGFWYTLKDPVYDENAQTLSAQTTHFTDYSMIDGTQLVPSSAALNPSQSISINVQTCFREAISDPVRAALMYPCDEQLAPLGWNFSDWSVNGIPGGNSTVGRVTTVGSIYDARYTAPASAPTPNTVAVSVNATHGGTSELLVCNVSIGTYWEGTATLYISQGTGDPSDVDEAALTLTWGELGSIGSQQYFTPNGSATYSVWPWPGCAQVSFVPDTQLITTQQGLLTIDHSTDPPTFSWWVGTYWNAEYCTNCGDGVSCETRTAVVATDLIEGTVSADGNTISGHYVEPINGDGYDFTFTRHGSAAAAPRLTP